MQQTQTFKPVILNLDTDPKYQKENASEYILNQEISINPNGGVNGGATMGKQTPSPANVPACEVEQPSGENYTILKYSSLRTQEAFNGVYNSNGVNWIQRIKANGQCDIVYHGDCLKFNPEPKHAIEQFRCGMRVEKICKNWSGKELVWCDGDMVSPGCLDYEASIATNFFTTPFFDICPDPCAYIQLCVPEICGCITAQFIPLLFSEISLSNYIADKGLKFMVKHVYYDGRASEWSDYSSLYYQERDCLQTGAGLSRCLKLRVPIGNPMVEKIVIAFSEDGGATWNEYETVEKYKSYNNSQQQWYQRELSEIVSSTFSDVDCSFDYIFCNDKNRKAIAPTEFTRERNPLPRKAQTLIQFADKFAFFNYEDGVCPLPITEIEKMNIGVQCDESGCVSDIVNLTVRAIIYKPFYIANFPDTGFIYRLGGNTALEQDNPLDTAYYDSQICVFNIAGLPGPVPIGQRFYDNTRNFIVYIEGTSYWAEMKQWKANKFFTNRRLVGVIPELAVDTQRNTILGDLNNGDFYYQEAIIKVPKGTKGILRMVSHEASDGDVERQATSEAIVGTLVDINSFQTQHGTQQEQAANNINYNRHEIFFDTCNGDVDLKETFLILDNFISQIDGALPVFSGYMKDGLGFPFEGLTFPNPAMIEYDQSLPYQTVSTDHNGFYNFVLLKNPAPTFDFDLLISGEKACNEWGLIQTEHLSGAYEAPTTKKDIFISDSTYDFSNTRYANPKVTVTDCNGGILSNIKVAISGSKFAITDAFGVATFRVRNYKDKPRIVTAVLTNANGCITLTCTGTCNPCDEISVAYLPTCFNPIPSFIMGAFVINVDDISDKNGLKSGGLYGFAIVAKGSCGRLSAAYELPKINIPRLQETLAYKFCKFTYDGTGMQFPDWTECVEIVRTANLNTYELQWVIDKVERTNQGYLKITFQSLNDYNTQFFQKTNTVYQFLQGDRVEFISNDGSIIDAATHGILNYLILSPFYDSFFHGGLEEPADYFNQILVKDDGRLSFIKAGAIIEFQRPKQVEQELNPYFGICAVLNTVRVPNGDGTFHTELLNPIGEFRTFDTYFIRRNIGGNIENFQHHSPSDFWGTRLTDAGRPFFKNQYENEKRYGRNITVNSPTQLNYFGDFIKTFDGILGGDITGAFIQDDRDLLVVGEYDSFLARISNGLLQLDKNGNIQAAPIDQFISNPNDQPFGIYGCQYDDIGCLISGDGFVCWWDSNMMAYVKHDYQIAKDVSINKVQSFIEKRTVQKNFINGAATSPLDKIRFATGQNSRTKDVYITLKRLRDSGINNEKAPYLKLNETIRFNPLIDEFLSFASFTPEGYSFLNLQDANGCMFITYLNGNTYIHPVINTVFNSFYGVACDQLVIICINKFPDKQKVFIALEIQSIQKWFAVSVVTDKTNYLSEITPKKVKEFQRKWNAPFMGNINSRGGLFGTELPSGYYCKVLLLKNNTITDIYNSINPVEQTKWNELDQIISKFAMKEETGFTENL